ncbi:MAG: transcriptional regulator [Spirochaetes bacterium RBG_16_49_21]|nr:MAG: transcriptional regulator [Spirochaetes bacterium RBG_16_49_21]
MAFERVMGNMFKVGDNIVYPMHGVGRIESIEKKIVLGKRGEYYIITILSSGMKVMIPVKNAEQIGIRGIIPKRDVKKVVFILVKDEISSVDDWKERYQNNMDKVKSGSIYEVSEVARDLYRRGREKELSIMERKLYENAYQLVTHEIALSKNIDIEEAGNLVSEALSTHHK